MVVTINFYYNIGQPGTYNIISVANVNNAHIVQERSVLSMKWSDIQTPRSSV